MLALLLVALSVGLDNLGASTALGVAGVDGNLRVRVVLIFGAFEGAMPVVGLLLGHSLAHHLGSGAKPIGGLLLGVAGAYIIVSELAGFSELGGFSEMPGSSELAGFSEVPGSSEVGGEKETASRPGPKVTRLVVIGAALSIDNLVIGFALGTYHVNLVVAAVVIAAVSVALSLLGLEIGMRLGERLGRRSELAGGAVLILVGVAIGTGLF